jgi:xanthine dehydrogenase accessory factor
MRELFQKITESIHHKQKVALATVISRKGSLPMSKQAKMLVFPDGSILGTIGGGAFEASVIREAQQVLSNETPKILEVDLTSDQIEADGLTCGGTVGILIECFTPKTDMRILHEITRVYTGSQSVVIATLLNEKMDQRSEIRRPSGIVNRKMVIYANGTTVGTSGDEAVDANIVQFALTRLGKDCQEVLSVDLSEQAARKLGRFPETQLRVLLETVLPRPTAYLFGGGHISFHLSKILRFIGFDFVVIDDRKEFANCNRFPDAKECIVQDFEHVVEHLSFDPFSSYLIIVTRGHKSDLFVLEQAIRANVKYIGMIGSRRKIQLIFQQLQEQGISKDLLDTVHAPIGLDIEADTPEEITISIAAELIKVRRGKQ